MRERDEREYDECFRAAFAPVARTVYLIVHDKALAEDVTQEALYRLLRHWSSVSRYESPAGLGAARRDPDRRTRGPALRRAAREGTQPCLGLRSRPFRCPARGAPRRPGAGAHAASGGGPLLLGGPACRGDRAHAGGLRVDGEAASAAGRRASPCCWARVRRRWSAMSVEQRLRDGFGDAVAAYLPDAEPALVEVRRRRRGRGLVCRGRRRRARGRGPPSLSP